MKRFSILFIMLAVILPLAISQTLTVTNGAVINNTFTRPYNATQYTDKDVVGDSASATAGRTSAMVFRLAGITEGQAFAIRQATLVVDSTNATTATFDLLLFRDTISVGADNAPFVADDLNFINGNYLGKVSFTLGILAASGDVAFAQTAPTVYGKLKTGKTGIYGVLVATGAYTPKRNAKFHLQLVTQYL